MVDYLDLVNWLCLGIWLVYGIYFNDEEIVWLGVVKVGVCYCFCFNMVLVLGICCVCELEVVGCLVGLGVDGLVLNDGFNMVGEVCQVMMLQWLCYGVVVVSYLDVWWWVIQGGVVVLGCSDIGCIVVGLQVDLVLFKMDELWFFGSYEFLVVLLLCGVQKVDWVMVGGEWIVIDGEILGLDWYKLMVDYWQVVCILVDC